MHHRLQVNDRLGDYRITGFLGEGGMGVVYRGVHEKLGRQTAIKVLNSTATSDPSFKSRFMNEARLQAGLHHPNVATLYDFREHADELVIFMELVDGDSLDELVERRVFTVDETLTVFASICEAIAYIHDKGVIHRDIKAQNAKLTASGVVKLLDFGIAKDALSHGLTQTGGIIGTPNYLSPEQLSGSPASPQTDIWALGVLLYEMLTGQLPFRAESLGMLVSSIAKGNFAPVENINPAVPRNVTSIVAKCLKQNPRSRYATARDLLSEVRESLEKRRAHIEPRDLRTAVVRSLDKPREGRSPTSETSASKMLPTSVTHRTRVRRAVLAAVAVGGVVLLVLTMLALYVFDGSAQTGCADNLKPVRVAVDEGQASVLRDGDVIGVSPLSLCLKPGESVRLKLRREGYEDRDVTVSDGKPVWTSTLMPKE